MAWLHTWAGVCVGWILYFVFVTGTLGYFAVEIDQWMTPERPVAAVTVDAASAADTGVRRLLEVAPDAERWTITPPGHRENPDLQVAWSGADPGRETEILHAETGEPADYRETAGGSTLYRMHYQLAYLPRTAASWIVGAAALAMLVVLLAGVVIHRHLFRDAFTLRTGKGLRTWLDAHTLAGVLALPFHLMITYSGLVLLGVTYMSVVVAAGYGSGADGRQAFFSERSESVRHISAAGEQATLAEIAPLVQQAESRWGDDSVGRITIQNPGDAEARVAVARHTERPLRTREQLVFDGVSGELVDHHTPPVSAAHGVRDVLVGLHEGRFAQPILRWLYVLCGFAGAAMVATGLVLWTTKRRQQRRAATGVALVERLNVAVVAGLPIGVLSYFLANRLLPVGLDGRADWEVHAMFIVWAAAFAHAAARPPGRAWVEQIGAGAVLAALLPMVNFLTTDIHLGRALAGGNWVLAGVDGTALAFSALLAGLLIRSRRRAADNAAASARRRGGMRGGVQGGGK
ncbi:PepSY-associated TM helix domain-containing protein [Aquisalimonas asiatica]|nr:PepSY-associated TM helix domain-containing protein [Aquisalimonas asiatica]